MSYLLGAVAFIVALIASVMLHEAGHFFTAKRFGMKATQFFVGFGPTIWSTRRGETEYGVKAILLGGFVKILGYTPLEEIDPKDEPRAFYRQPAPKRAVVIGAGVVVNIVLGFVLLIVLAMAVGVPRTGADTTVVSKVSDCVPASAQAAEKGVCRPGDQAAPARQAGIRQGDRIVAFDGRPVKDWNELAQGIRAHQPGPVAIVIERAGKQQTLQVNLAPVPGRPGGFLGMAPTYEPKTLGPVAATGYAVRTTGRIFAGIGEVLVDIPRAIPKLFTPERAKTPGGTAGSIVGGAQLSGQVFAADVSWRDKIGIFLSLVISLNIFVGALNVLPLLPLDGGHLAVLCYERIKAWLARVRGRPDPGPVDLTKLMPLTYVAVVLLVGLGVLLILADVINPLKITQ